MNLDALALAAADALAAAEQRGFERALSLIQQKLREQPDSCIVFDTDKGGEGFVKVEIGYDEDGRFIEGRRLSLSDVLYEQYPTCKGSTEEMLRGAEASLVELRKIIENWGKPA